MSFAAKRSLVEKEPTANQLLYDVEHYDLFLAPSFADQRLDGAVTTRLTSLTDGLDAVEFDLVDDLSVLLVQHNDQPVSYTHENDILRIDLLAPLDEGATASIFVQYTGYPQPAGLLGLEFNEHAGVPLVATLSEPYYSHTWWPCKDVATDKVTSAVIVHVPAGMYAASNGILTHRIPEGDGEYFVWKNDMAIAPYLISIAVTNYVQWTETWVSPSGKSMPVEYNVFPEDLEVAQYEFERTTQMLDFYSELFGEYPYVDQKYGMAEFVYQGAMEHQTMSSYGNFYLTGDRFYERLVAHELLHHWFGNANTVEDWNEIWLHEGFATYGEALWIEHTEGMAAYLNFMRKRDFPGPGFIGPIIPPGNLFGNTVYRKGALLLHMLRHVVGDNDFFQGLRDWTDATIGDYGNVTTDEFVASMSASLGQDLNWFFDQWLYYEGRPEFDLSWDDWEQGGQYGVKIKLHQTQTQTTYVMPVDVRVQTANGNEDFVVWTNSPTQSATFFVSSEPTDVVIDPDNWLIERVTLVESPSTDLGSRLWPAEPNPFNPSTVFRFTVAKPGPVQLSVFDTRGRLVRRIDAGYLPTGPHEITFRGEDDRGARLSSGVYRLLLEAPDGRRSRSITLVQ